MAAVSPGCNMPNMTMLVSIPTLGILTTPSATSPMAEMTGGKAELQFLLRNNIIQFFLFPVVSTDLHWTEFPLHMVCEQNEMMDRQMAGQQ